MGAEALFNGEISGVLETVVLADRKGVDLVSLGDHLGFSKSSHASRLETHKFPFALEQPWYEPITFLSAAAALTKRIRLGTFVLIAPLRPTLLLAKQLATLDVISNGRVTISLGVGWQEPEFRAAGMPFEGRFGDLEDMVNGMRALWGPPPATFKGRNFEFEDFYALPTPAQGRDLPILFGLHPTAKNFDRMARLAQGWAVDVAHRPIFAEKAREYREIIAQHGGDPAKAELHVGQRIIHGANGEFDKAAVRDSVRELVTEGGTTVTFRLADYCKRAEDIDSFLDYAVGLKA